MIDDDICELGSLVSSIVSTFRFMRYPYVFNLCVLVCTVLVAMGLVKQQTLKMTRKF